MVLWKQAIHIQKFESRPLSLITYRAKSKEMKEVNVKTKTFYLLEDKISKKFGIIGCGQGLSKQNPSCTGNNSENQGIKSY